MNRSGWVIPVLLIVAILVLIGLYTVPHFKMAVQPAADVSAKQAPAPPARPDYEHPPLTPELAGIRLGMSKEQLTAALGDPVSSETTQNGALLVYNGLSVSLMRGQVSFIRVTAPGWRTPAGLEVGQEYWKLEEAYRHPDLSYISQDGQERPAGERIRLYFTDSLEFGVSENNETITAMWLKPSSPGPFPESSLIVDPALEKPVIRRYGREYVVYISPAIRDAIDKYDPSFTTWRLDDYLPRLAREYLFTGADAPFAVVGDFNGDKIPDMVLDGHASKYAPCISVLSEGSGYRIVEMQRVELFDPHQIRCGEGEYGISEYFGLVPAGKIESAWEDNSLMLEADAFETVFYGKGAMVYYYKDGKWEQYTTGD